MTKAPVKRCAIYTRKSHEEGLEQEFNSLHAQREACEAFIKSQRHEGWELVKAHYDDGGFTGGNMERPALKQLLSDIEDRKVDVIVVYKVDRLTRSLSDFAKMIEILDKHSVSFVSVTQQFNTTTSMGRLTLNVLLSFAQFEREVTGERIRDKIAASKKKGIWMGGTVPLGYDAKERKLVINPQEVETVQIIFRRYLDLGCVQQLQEDIEARGIRSKVRKNGMGSIPSRGMLYKMLSNPIYIGQIRHKGVVHPGQHEPIITQDLWERVQQGLKNNAVKPPGPNRKTEASMLMGKLFDASGHRLTPSHANKRGRRYRYYISRHQKGESAWRLPAHEIENTVVRAVCQILDNQTAIMDALRNSGMDAKRIPAAVDAAKAMSHRLGRGEDVNNLTATMLIRAELKQDSMRVKLTLASLTPECESEATITQDIPIQLQRHGIEARLVIGGANTPRSDPALIRAIAFACIWFEELESGQVKNIAGIAKLYGFSEQHVSSLLRLAFLSPDIVEAIEKGAQPVSMTAEGLVKRVKLPWEWNRQKKELRINL